MIGLGGFDDGTYMGGMPASSLAWLMFVQSGNLGLYRLYRDLSDGEERTPFD